MFRVLLPSVTDVFGFCGIMYTTFMACIHYAIMLIFSGVRLFPYIMYTFCHALYILILPMHALPGAWGGSSATSTTGIWPLRI